MFNHNSVSLISLLFSLPSSLISYPDLIIYVLSLDNHCSSIDTANTVIVCLHSVYIHINIPCNGIVFIQPLNGGHNIRTSKLSHAVGGGGAGKGSLLCTCTCSYQIKLNILLSQLSALLLCMFHYS